MIRYALKCSQDHSFESWFQSASAFDRLEDQGLLSCAVCGDGRVSKALMAPHVQPERAEMLPAPRPEPGPGALTLPNSDIERAIAELRRKVEESADYVGADFAAVARAIHSGEVEERAIWGEARAEEARALIEEGVPVAPLPFLPARKAN